MLLKSFYEDNMLPFLLRTLVILWVSVLCAQLGVFLWRRHDETAVPYCFSTMSTFPRNLTHDDGADHAWFIFNLHTEILFLYLHNMQSIIWAWPLFARNKKTSYLEGRCLAHGGEIPSTLIPCLVATAHPLLSNPSLLSHLFPTPSAHIMLHQQSRSSCPEQLYTVNMLTPPPPPPHT